MPGTFAVAWPPGMALRALAAVDRRQYRRMRRAVDRPLVSLPLLQEISDVNLHWNRRVTMAQWAALVCEALDTLYREGRDSGRLFALPLHPWCIGQPFRV